MKIDVMSNNMFLSEMGYVVTHSPPTPELKMLGFLDSILPGQYSLYMCLPPAQLPDLTDVEGLDYDRDTRVCIYEGAETVTIVGLHGQLEVLAAQLDERLLAHGCRVERPFDVSLTGRVTDDRYLKLTQENRATSKPWLKRTRLRSESKDLRDVVMRVNYGKTGQSVNSDSPTPAIDTPLQVQFRLVPIQSPDEYSSVGSLASASAQHAKISDLATNAAFVKYQLRDGKEVVAHIDHIGTVVLASLEPIETLRVACVSAGASGVGVDWAQLDKDLLLEANQKKEFFTLTLEVFRKNLEFVKTLYMERWLEAHYLARTL